jgi:hypothetical protein
MKIFIVAQIYQGSNLAGYRLLDIDDNNKVRDLPLASIVKTLSNPKTANIIENAQLVNGVVTGTNGTLSRYASINTQGRLVGASPLVVINQIENLGYTVSDFKGCVTKMSNDKVVEYAKGNGIANGKVVVKDNIEYISSINGAYEQVELKQEKPKENVKMKSITRITNDKGTSGVATNVKSEVDLELAYKDVFSALTKAQRLAITQYYTWYTVNIYESMAHSVRLNIAPGKAERLTQLRGTTSWVYGGIIDSHLEGRYSARCELGHPLQYEHYALPEELNEKIKKEAFSLRTWARHNEGGSRALIEQGAIVFGETCAGDFFNISPEDMKRLTKTRQTMTDEVDILSDVITNNKIDEFKNKCKMLYEAIQKLGSADNVVDIFGVKVGYTLLNFMKSNVPFTKSLVILAGDEIRKDKKKFFKAVTQHKHDDILDIIYSTDNADMQVVRDAIEYLDYTANYSIEGLYQYNPLTDKEATRRDIGGYNDKTRKERRYLVSRICSSTGLSPTQFNSFDYMDKYLTILETAYEISFKAETYIEKSEILNRKFNQPNPNKERRIDRENDIIRAIQEDFVCDVREVQGQDNIDKMDVLISGMIFSRKRRYHAYLTRRTKEFYGRYRTQRLETDFNSLYELYQTQAIKPTTDVFVKDAMGMFEAKLIKDEKAQEELDYVTPRNVEFILRDNSDSSHIMNGRPAVAIIPGLSDTFIKRMQDKGEDSVEVYNKLSIDLVDIVSIRDLTETEYQLKQSIYNDITRENEDKQRRLAEATIAKMKESEELEKSLKSSAKANSDKKKEKELVDDKKKETKSATKKESKKSEDKLATLKKLLDEHPDVSDYGITVAKDILRKAKSFDDLSSKQQWRINATIKQLSGNSEENSENGESKQESVPEKKKLSENPDIQAKVDKIIQIYDESNDENENKRYVISEVSPIAHKIAYTVKRSGEISDKQLKHIEKAYQAVTKYEETHNNK